MARYYHGWIIKREESGKQEEAEEINQLVKNYTNRVPVDDNEKMGTQQLRLFLHLELAIDTTVSARLTQQMRCTPPSRYIPQNTSFNH